MEDAALRAFSVFFTQAPSFLAYQRAVAGNKGRSNAQSLFGVHQIPSDNQIRSLLDEVSPSCLLAVFEHVIAGARKTLFDDLRALTRYMYFDSCNHLREELLSVNQVISLA